MKMFIIVGLLFTFTVGGFVGVMTIGGFPEKHDWKKKLIALIVSFIIGFGIAGGLALHTTLEQKEWNDGRCPDCGVEWRLVNVQHIRNEGEVYYYICNECGKVIEQGK